MEQRRRIGWLDTAKALGIYAMLITHASLGEHWLNRFLFGFHMPLFFLLYGLQTQRARIEAASWKSAALAGARGYLVPYFCFALLLDGRAPDLHMTRARLAGILYGSHFSLSEASSMAALWFLPCFFLAVQGYRLLFRLVKTAKHRALWLWLAAALLAAAAWLLRYESGHANWPWGANIALNGMVFMLAGHALQPVRERLTRLSRRWPPLLAGMALAGAALWLGRCNWRAMPDTGFPYVIMGMAFYGNYGLYFAAALTACAAVLLLARAVDCAPLRFAGRNTLGILLFQQAGAWAAAFIPFSHFLPVPGWNMAKAAFMLLIALACACAARWLFPPLVGRPLASAGWKRRPTP